MNAASTKNTSLTDWASFDAMTDADIDTSEIPPLDEEFFNTAALRLPKPRAAITLNLDAEVVDWFESQGMEYQERINLILRFYMETQKKKVG